MPCVAVGSFDDPTAGLKVICMFAMPDGSHLVMFSDWLCM